LSRKNVEMSTHGVYSQTIEATEHARRSLLCPC
jgi:hypothetical protein